jgi:hypothetical protein
VFARGLYIVKGGVLKYIFKYLFIFTYIIIKGFSTETPCKRPKDQKTFFQMSVKIFGKSRLSVFFNKNDFAEFPLSFEKFFILLHRQALTRVAPALLKGCSKDVPS